ncbi:hypothetical protein [Frankia canadensis]|nr:hypothetical protein [Frankia canadensis]
MGAAGAGVPAGWAVYGKVAGTADDYSVLRSSGAYFSRADYDGILRRFVPGTPPPRPQRSEASGLPWATISYAPLRSTAAGGDADASVLGLAVCDWTDVTDGAGRPVAATSYLCAPFAACAALPLGYEDLHLALLWDPAVAAALGPGAIGPRLPLADPPAQAGEVTLGSLPGLGPAHVAQALEADPATFWLAAGTAALLLCQPVALLGAPALEPSTRIAERLRFLDAVAALLPYGQRARLVVSTWADSGSTHRIRLAYTDRARPGDAAVTLAGPNREPSVPALPRGAREYHALLVELHGNRGVPVERIVEHLCDPAYRAARRIADPRHALLSLADLPGPTYFATRFAAPAPPRIRDAAPAARSARPTAAGGRGEVRGTVARRDGTAAEVVSEIVGLVRAQRQRRRLLVGASSAESDAAVLTVLAARTDTDAVALELVRLAIEDDLRGADAEHLGLPTAAPHTVGWLGWLGRADGPGAAVRPFARMISGPIDPGALSALAARGRALRGDSRYALAFVRLARLTGRRRSLDQPLWQWLTAAGATGTLASPECAVWAEELSRPPIGSAVDEARLDLLRLLLGAGPAEPLRARMLSVYWIDYHNALIADYRELISRYERDTRRLTVAALVMNGLAASLDRAGWPDDDRAVDDTLRLLARMAQRVRWIPPGLRATLAVYLSAAPKVRLRRSEAEQWMRDMLALYAAGPTTRGAP